MKRWLMEAWKVLLNLSRGEPSPVKTPSLLRLQSLPDLGTFRGPVLELVEELVLLLLAQRLTTTCLPARLDGTGEVRLEPLYVGTGGYLRCAAPIAPPAESAASREAQPESRRWAGRPQNGIQQRSGIRAAAGRPLPD